MLSIYIPTYISRMTWDSCLFQSGYLVVPQKRINQTFPTLRRFKQPSIGEIRKSFVRAMSNYIRLLRPHQWVKNLFIFLPLFFGGQFLDISLFCRTLATFFAFCFISGSIYCFNDIWDVGSDRLHPKKKDRPIASGKVSRKAGYVLMACCLVLALFLLLIGRLPASLFFVFGFYFLMNIAYCVQLKQIAMVDVFIISVGFVLRIIAGGLATGILLSQWIVIMTFLLALFLAFAKRRDDLFIYDKTGVLVRKNVVKYNSEFLNAALIITATITIVAYILYTVTPEVTGRLNSHYVYITSLFVLAGVLRYLQLTLVREGSGSPTKVLLKDKYIRLCILCWIGMFVVIMYCKH